MSKTALVFSGGGSRGAYEIGVWRALRELDEHIDMVTGTSVGALNGAVVAQGSADVAEQLWRELETSHVFDVTLDETLPIEKKLLSAVRAFGREAIAHGGAGTQALATLLEKYIDEQQVRKSSIDFGLVTVQMDDLTPNYLWLKDIPQGRLHEFLIASCALFPAIRPQEIDGKRYIDGGFRDNLPISMALSRGADKIIAVHMDAVGFIPRTSLPDGCSLRIIKCYWKLGAILLFDPNSARQNMRLGYLDAMRSYGVYDGCAYAFTKGMLASAVRRYYSDFYNMLGLLGVQSEKKRFLPTLAYQKIEKRVFRRGVRASAVRGFALDGMEGAAELLGLDAGVLYTPERFYECLRQAYDRVELPASLRSLKLTQENLFEAVTAALEPAKRPVRVKFLTELIARHLAQNVPCNLLPVAALLTDEFSAAVFLAQALLLNAS